MSETVCEWSAADVWTAVTMVSVYASSLSGLMDFLCWRKRSWRKPWKKNPQRNVSCTALAKPWVCEEFLFRSSPWAQSLRCSRCCQCHSFSRSAPTNHTSNISVWWKCVHVKWKEFRAVASLYVRPWVSPFFCPHPHELHAVVKWCLSAKQKQEVLVLW